MSSVSLRKYTLRAETSADEPFLRLLYAGTRDEEMALVDWSEAEKRRFLDFQFSAQHEYYLRHFPEASFQIIECGDARSGRLYVVRLESELRIIDIALIPEFRNRGIGTQILKGILDEAERDRSVVTIHVEINNAKALALYQRLGFRFVEDRGTHLFMRWSP